MFNLVPFGFRKWTLRMLIIIAFDFYFSGKPVVFTTHPGLPVYYLGYLVMHLFGFLLNDVQRYLDFLYLLAGLSSTLSLLFFYRLNLRKWPLGLSVLTIASVLAWPGFWTFLNHLSPETFVVSVGLPTLAVFWYSLSQQSKLNRLNLLIGVGCGFCLATKFTSMPIVIGMLGGAMIHFWRTPKNVRGHPRHHILIAPLSAAITFIILAIPILNRLTIPFDYSFHGATKEISISHHPAYLVFMSPFFIFLLVWFSLFFFVLMAKFIIGQNKNHVHNGSPSGLRDVSLGEVDFLAGSLFILIGWVSFWVLVVKAKAIYFDNAYGFRYASWCALILPFMILYCYQFGLKFPEIKAVFKTKWFQVSCLAIGIIAITVTLQNHVLARNRLLDDCLYKTRITRSWLQRNFSPDYTIAFYDGSGGCNFGKASFHFWGNYIGSAECFDEEMIKENPGYSYLRIRELIYSIRHPDAETMKLYDQPEPYNIRRIDKVVVGEDIIERPILIVLPWKNYHKKFQKVTSPPISIKEYMEKIEKHFGQIKYDEQLIAGEKWILLDIP